jgi:hypothetical protein
MPRPIVLLMVLSAIVVATGCALASVHLADQGPVYSVAAVRSHLEQDPWAWVGRTVQVRGLFVFGACDAWLDYYTGVCVSWQGLVDPDPSVGSPVLPLTLGDPPRLLAALRRLAFLGDLMPAPQVLHPGTLATYRVQLQAIANSFCDTGVAGVCVKAVLLDPAPGQW